MLKTVLNWAVAFLPLVCLLGLILVHKAAMDNYFLCQDGRVCISIPEGARTIFAPRAPNDCDPPWTDTKAKEPGSLEADALRYSGRLNSLFLLMLYVIVWVIALGVGLAVIYWSLAERKWMLISGLALAIGLTLFARYFLQNSPVEYLPVLRAIAPCTINLDVHHIFDIVNRWSSFGFAVGFLMWLATCAVLVPAKPSASLNENLKKLSLRMKYLNYMLAVDMLILVVGILLERAIFQWSIAFVSGNEPATKAADNFITNLVAFDGGFYTLMLAGLYLPAAWIIRRRAERQEGWAAHESKTETLEKLGLNFSIAKSMPRIAAILAPLVAGPIGQLLTHLGK